MKSSLFFVLAVLTFSLSACSGNKLVEIKERKGNQTSIEGRLSAPDIYKYKSPALLFPNSNHILIKYGEIIERDEEGVLFAEKKKGLFDAGDTLFFKYDELRAIVDSNSFCVWGELKDREKDEVHYVFDLDYPADEDYSRIYLDLVPDTNFAYSLRPGYYKLEKIYMLFPENSRKEILFESVPDTIGYFEIKENTANYLGNIEILASEDKDKANWVVSYKQQRHGMGNSSAAVGMMTGMVGGLIEGAVIGIGNSVADSCGAYRFSIEYRDDFKAKGNSNTTKTEIIPWKEQISEKE